MVPKQFLFIISIVATLMFSLATCPVTKSKTTVEQTDSIQYYFESGKFLKARELIYNVQQTNKHQSNELDIILEKMERISLDFSKNQKQIRLELLPYFPALTDSQMCNWELRNVLEVKLINGEKRYFRNAIPNLFRLDSVAKKIKIAKEGEVIPPLQKFCIDHSTNILKAYNHGNFPFVKKKKFRIDYSITLKPNVLPNGEIIKCWMPFPRISNHRQQNIKLLKVNSENYEIANNSFQQRSLYIEKTTINNQPLIFNYSAEFETSADYKKIVPENIQAYDTLSDLFITHTKEKLPHITFSPNIKKLANEIIGIEKNPYQRVKQIYYWIDKNIPWASALEYSTIYCIPEYVLKNRHGDCGMKTLLFMSLARVSGIPCKWQSGWMLHPGKVNLHDWCEVYYEGIGWVPLDQSFGLQDSENISLKEFYISGIDAYRLIINDDFSSDFFPEKKFFRSEPIDFQRGELESEKGNIYFNNWSYKMNVTYL